MSQRLAVVAARAIMENEDPSAGPQPLLTDSPWFWLILFLCGGLIALALTGPKYSWRQPQLERQYQAREISGQSVSPAEGRQPLSQPGQPMLSLRPLTLLFAAALCVSMILYWLTRLRRRS
jgi:hypothetical protein